MTGNMVALRALQSVGTPFRLHGRLPGVALDCVGLAADALNITNAPICYNLRGNYKSKLNTYLDDFGLIAVTPSAHLHDGDLALVEPAPRQLHLMIRAAGGWVHGHAGLRKVVHMPGVSPWPIIALRRISGG